MGARDATPDILEQLAEAERLLKALASRANDEGFTLVVEAHVHTCVEEGPAYVDWTPFLEQRTYAPQPLPKGKPDLSLV